MTELPSPLVSAFKAPLTAPRFHRMLREREQALARDPAHRLFGAREGRTASPSFAAAPAVGIAEVVLRLHQHRLRQLRLGDGDGARWWPTRSRSTWTIALHRRRSATARSELNDIAKVFDDFLYPIDTLNFGRESDIDANGVVQVLLTPRINALSGNCNTTGSVILGYFFALDLLSDPNSNNGEVFYSLVPDPLNTQCTIGKEAFAKPNLAPTFVHEFQHMISYASTRSCGPATRRTPGSTRGCRTTPRSWRAGSFPTPPGSRPGTTYTQYALSNYLNAYEYLVEPRGQLPDLAGRDRGLPGGARRGMAVRAMGGGPVRLRRRQPRPVPGPRHRLHAGAGPDRAQRLGQRAGYSRASRSRRW